MNILGIHIGHDASVSIVKNGKLVSAISAERILKIKKIDYVSKETIQYCLDSAQITLEDIDVVAISNYDATPRQPNKKILSIFIDGEIIDSVPVLFGDKYLETTGILLGKNIPVIIVPHHTAHAASAYYTSSYDESWCFTMDSSGGNVQNNSLIAKGIGNKLYPISCPGLMIGHAYAQFTTYLNLGDPLFKAGSTMGLASYGKPLKQIKNNIDRYISESYFEIKNDLDDNTEYTDYYAKLWTELSELPHLTFLPKNELNSLKAINLAASIQYLFEESILDTINNKINQDDVNNLCLSGGSFLNCNVNSRIKNETKFTNIHHFPACGDEGIAVGAALYVAHHIYDEPRYKYSNKEICYLGEDSIKVKEINYRKIANFIAEGKIVAWFNGKSEYGPRALGNRSILADPRNQHNREILNFILKKREWFRPFAPIVLEEKTKEWFDFNGKSPFMLYTAQVLKQKEIPAVTHIDGSARIQTVNIQDNPDIYNLIIEFEKITGIPLLLNTSLNGSGQPIIEDKNDAILFLYNNDVDVLMVNGEIILKEDLIKFSKFVNQLIPTSIDN
jgi:carbamoyltransferase